MTWEEGRRTLGLEYGWKGVVALFARRGRWRLPVSFATFGTATRTVCGHKGVVQKASHHRHFPRRSVRLVRGP